MEPAESSEVRLLTVRCGGQGGTAALYPPLSSMSSSEDRRVLAEKHMTDRNTYDEIAAAVRRQTVLTEFLKTIEIRPDAIALRWRDGDAWRQWSWRTYAEHVAHFAGGLRRLGFQRGDRAVLMLRNRPEFHVADVGVLLAGGTPSSIFEASSSEQVQHILAHLDPTVAIVEGGCLHKLLRVRQHVASLRHLVVLDDLGGLFVDGVIAYQSVLEEEPISLDAAATVRPDDLLTVVYTSGTTGPPKGVMITHENACWWIESVFRAFGSNYSATGKRQLSYLPMATMAERLATHYLHLAKGTEVTTCPDSQQLDVYLREVRPQIFLGVPRVWEKLHAGILAGLAADPVKEALLQQALDVGYKVAAARSVGTLIPANLQVAWEQAETFGLSQVRELIGLDQCEIALSGTAPLSVEVVKYFLAIGIPLSESYGLSESTAVTMELLRRRPGTVGRPIPGCQIRLLPDGEIVLRSGNLFRGYLKDPENTAEVMDPEGWFHTGDIGAFDEDGYLRIIGRKKELIVTPDGKNVSPANLEAALKSSCSLVGQVCVLGDRRPYLVALLVLDPKVAPAWARARGFESANLAELAAHPEVRAEVKRGVTEANQRFSILEYVRRFTILSDEWLPGSEELTPTMKLRRQSILRKYGKEIEVLYREEATAEFATVGHA